MKWIILLVCALVIVAAALDLRCGAATAGPHTIVLACRAGRL